MPIIILIPCIACIIALFRDSVPKAFLNIYLPVFFFVPIYYFWKVAALPPIDFSESVLLPLGLAILLTQMRFWRPTLMDLSMALFLFTSCYSDALAGHETAYIFDLFFSLMCAFVPYAIGKTLIEQQGNRIATVRRIVFFLAISCIIGAYEYRMGQNPYTMIFARFFPGETFPWKTQIRWGFGRVSGPFGQSELAGIILFFGIVLALWLSYNHLWERRIRHLEWLPLTKSTTLLTILIFTLLMTQARGPWLGCIVAVPVAFIGRRHRILRAAILTTAFIAIFGSLAYLGLKAYTSGPTTSAEQENAQYRTQLLDNYAPIARQGGAWGWGQDFPRVPGQGSIDNEYLFVALTQGWVGLLAFALIAAETLIRLTTAAILAPTKPDRYFAFSLLGVFLGFLLTIFTVFLGNQTYQLFFLLAGWSQALPIPRHQRTRITFEQVLA